MISRRTFPFGAAAMLLLACSGAQTKDPVVTVSDDGKTTSPSGDAAAKRGTSFVRFVNAMPGDAGLNLGAEKGDLFGRVDFKAVTKYLEMGDNLARFSLRATADGNEMATSSEAMSDGFRYTVVGFADSNGVASLRVLRDELVPDSGKARIRVIHAAPGIRDVDLAVQGEREPLFDDINYGTEAGYQDVAPMTATFEIRRDGGNGKVIRLPRMALEAGKAYTIVLTGKAPDQLAAFSFDDTVMTGTPLSLGGEK
jgi:hypothetical protein